MNSNRDGCAEFKSNANFYLVPGTWYIVLI